MNFKTLLFALTGFLFLMLLSNVYAIDISTCQILDTPGTYYLTADISNQVGNCFEIRNSSITLDCQGHVIDGDGDSTGYGVYVNAYDYGDISNVTIRNCTVQEFDYGVYFRGGNGNKVTESFIIYITLSHNPYGIYLYYSFSNTLTNITSSNNGYGIFLSYSSFNTLTNIVSNDNWFEGIRLYYSSSNTLIDVIVLNNVYSDIFFILMIFMIVIK